MMHLSKELEFWNNVPELKSKFCPFENGLKYNIIGMYKPQENMEINKKKKI